jgi:hypothetical protein
VAFTPVGADGAVALPQPDKKSEHNKMQMISEERM